MSQFSCTITESLICLFVFLGRVFDLALGNLDVVVPSVCLCVCRLAHWALSSFQTVSIG